MAKFLLMTLLCIGALQASEDYRLILDDVIYTEVDSEIKVIFTLNNSYTFFGDLDEELIEIFNPGSSVTLECNLHEENRFFLSKREYNGPFFSHMHFYPITITEKTLEMLPKIASVDADEGILDSFYYITLDDGTSWCTNNHASPKFAEVYPSWKIGDRVMICYIGYFWYDLINVDAPTHLKKKNFIIDTRQCCFYKMNTIYW